MSGKATDMSIIEQYKENIQPLPGGRSASKLEANFIVASKSALQLKDQLKEERKKLEDKLLDLEEVDDPLQEFLNYISWIRDNYPQGANTESGLLNLLERCTSCFRDTEHYKNDPRYLKVWLDYTKFSDSPKDIFVYLAKKGIGNYLALYYEEFAKYLELNEKAIDAKQVYELGIENEARPLIRLKKSYQSFLERFETFNGSEHEDRINIRGVLAIKRGTSVAPLETENLESDRKRPKIEIFKDEDNNDQQILYSIFKGPVSELGTIESRTKENIQEAKPWSGETLKQKMHSENTASKVEVFIDPKDDNDNLILQYVEGADDSVNTIIKNPGKRPEKVLINMDLLYPSPEEEYSLQEILAIRRKSINERKCIEKEVIENSIADISESNTSLSRHDEKSDSDYGQEANTFTIPLRDTTDNSVKMKNVPNSPTMTMFSRIATNEVIDMFNDAAKNLNSDDEDEKTDNTTNYDGFVTETIQIAHNDEDVMKDNLKKNVTPPTDREYSSDRSFHSSPFLETPSISNISTDAKLINPLDANIREVLLSNLTIPLSVYAGYNDFGEEVISRMRLFDSITNKGSKSIAKGFPSSIINFCGNKNYCLRGELGRGGFGVVYLIETETGEYEALKVESPSSKWEFYILHQAHRRLIGQRSVSSMIVKPYGLYYFKDESYLFINYFSQGTILDVVNNFRKSVTGVDECLCIFLTIELLKVVEVLHTIGILHGDLKADNCMLRFEQIDTTKWSDYYNREGLNGWSSKSITLIDFGRAIDLTLFDENTQFICDWKTDEQDCIQMNRNQPWSFEADYYGLAAIIHTMLFGTYIKINENTRNEISLENTFKRYWQRELWSDLFSVLLNPYPDEKLNNKKPLVDELRKHRNKFESWLEKHSAAHNLKSIILGIEYDLRESNKRMLQS